MEMLEITSPRETGPTGYEQYLVEGGRQLIVRIPIPEDYAATGLPQPEEYTKGAIPKHPIPKRLGPEAFEVMEVTKLEQGDIADEAYLARQAQEEELFARMKHQEEDLKAQEQRKLEDETRQWELKKKKREEEEAKKCAAFQKTEEYYWQKERLRNQMSTWKDTPYWRIHSQRVSPKFHRSQRRLWPPINLHTGAKEGALDNSANPLVMHFWWPAGPEAVPLQLPA